jgi:hypothetical protein
MKGPTRRTSASTRGNLQDRRPVCELMGNGRRGAQETNGQVLSYIALGLLICS